MSLATVELCALRAAETRMTFTEQAAFLDGEDGTRSREDGTTLHWTMRFDSNDAANAVRAFIEPANEENFDRLAAHIGLTTAGS